MEKRETLGSRLGFLLLSAGCAIGLGNVWRFPYVVGKYGGATFLIIYLLFLFFLGLPIMSMEFSIGRASKKNIGMALKTLEKPNSKWHIYGPIAIIGNYLLMAFFTVVTGWLLHYFVTIGSGNFSNLTSDQITNKFVNLLSTPDTQIYWMIISVVLGFGVCAIGLRNGVEKVIKVMMVLLFLLMLILAINSLFSPGAKEGLKFYLKPSLDPFKEYGVTTVLFAAMGQAFFTLSLGIGAMTIFGSYIDKSRTLTGESINVIALDTFVALMSGLIIFPACFSYGIEPSAGPSLIFITLPNIFTQMKLGSLIGGLFFLFMSFAALSTLIAVFENLISYWMDKYKLSRAKSALLNTLIVIIISIPCILGFNVLSDFHPLGKGTNILDLEDFIVSYTILPIGSLVILLFTTRKSGWGFDNFIAENNSGKGVKFFKWMYFYSKYILPIIIVVIFAKGYYDFFK